MAHALQPADPVAGIVQGEPATAPRGPHSMLWAGLHARRRVHIAFLGTVALIVSAATVGTTFADEPTSQLDADSAMAVVELLLVEAANGTTVIAVTHDPRVAAEMDQRITLSDGRLVR